MAKIRININELMARFEKDPDGLFKYLEQQLRGQTEIEQAKTFQLLGNHLLKEERLRSSFLFLTRSLAIFQTLEMWQQASDCLINLGIVNRQLGDFQAAIANYEAALVWDIEINNRQGQSELYTNLGVVHYSAGAFSEALTFYQKSKEIDEELDDQIGIAINLMNMAICKEMQGLPVAAMNDYEEASGLFASSGRVESEIRCLINIGGLLQRQGKFEEAIAISQSALATASRVNRLGLMAKCHNNIGNSLESVGEYRKGIEHLELALALNQQTGHLPSLSKVLGNLGNAYYALGDFARGLGYAQADAELSEKMGNSPSLARAYGIMGNCYNGLGDREAARRYYRKAMTLDHYQEDKSLQVLILINLANTYLEEANYAEAQKLFLDGLRINEETIRSLASQANILGNLSIIKWEFGAEEEALTLQHEAIQLASEIGRKSTLIRGWLNLKGFYSQREQWDQALHFCELALKASEELLLDLIEEQQQLFLFERLTDAYRHCLVLYIKTGKVLSAWEVLDRGNSRVFRGLLAVTRVNLGRSFQGSESLRLEESIILEKVRYEQLRRLIPNVEVNRPGVIEVLRAQLDEIYERMNQEDPSYVYLRRANPVSFTSLKQLLGT